MEMLEITQNTLTRSKREGFFKFFLRGIQSGKQGVVVRLLIRCSVVSSCPFRCDIERIYFFGEKSDSQRNTRSLDRYEFVVDIVKHFGFDKVVGGKLSILPFGSTLVHRDFGKLSQFLILQRPRLSGT